MRHLMTAADTSTLLTATICTAHTVVQKLVKPWMAKGPFLSTQWMVNPIHSPLDTESEAAAELDECNGHTTEADGYH